MYDVSMAFRIDVCVCEQNSGDPEEDPKAVLLQLHRHPVGAQSGASAGVSVVPGESLTDDLHASFQRRDYYFSFFNRDLG